LRYQARDDVGRAAGRIADDDAHRTRRIGLRPSGTRDCRQRGSARCQMQKSSTGKFHFQPPFTSFGLGVDHQFELARLHNRQVCGLSALEDTTGIDADLTIRIPSVGRVAHQATHFGNFAL